MGQSIGCGNIIICFGIRERNSDIGHHLQATLNKASFLDSNEHILYAIGHLWAGRCWGKYFRDKNRKTNDWEALQGGAEFEMCGSLSTLWFRISSKVETLYLQCTNYTHTWRTEVQIEKSGKTEAPLNKGQKISRRFSWPEECNRSCWY